MDDPGLYAFAPRRGMFEPKFALGGDVKDGALAGMIYDVDNPWADPVVPSEKAASPSASAPSPSSKPETASAISPSPPESLRGARC